MPIDLTTDNGSQPKDLHTGGTQDTLGSTVSSLQSSFQQEVERANALRKVVAEETARSLTHIQTKVNEKLTEMDRTIKIVHEG